MEKLTWEDPRTIGIMCYRIYATVRGNPDPMLALAEVGLLSNLEIWFGIIVACMPTMAPVFVTYIKPALSKISDRLRPGSSEQLSDGKPRADLETIGGSGNAKSKRKYRNNYTELSENYVPEGGHSGDLPLVRPGGAQLRTGCAHNDRSPPPSTEGVHVQRDFHTVIS